MASLSAGSGSLNLKTRKPLLKVVLSLFIFATTISLSSARGRMLEPGQRSSLWRLGFDSPINRDDNGLNCGGYWHQWQVNKGKCGVCGDPWESNPRPNEKGGKYFNGIIARTYYSDDVHINVAIEVKKNQKGYFEFRLCPEVSESRPVTQECLDRYPLDIVDHGKRYYPPSAGMIYLQVIKPEGVVCDRCVLQWKWHTALNWGKCENGSSQIGCGDQTEFYNCADIAILPRDQITGSDEPKMSEVFNPDSSIYIQKTPFDVTKEFDITVGTDTANLELQPTESPVDKSTSSYLITEGELYGVPVATSSPASSSNNTIASTTVEQPVVNADIVKPTPSATVNVETFTKRVDSSSSKPEVTTTEVINLPYIGSTTATLTGENEVTPTQDPVTASKPIADQPSVTRVKRQAHMGLGLGQTSQTFTYDAASQDFTGGTLLSPNVNDMGVGSMSDPTFMYDASLSQLTSNTGGPTVLPTMDPAAYLQANAHILGQSMFDLGVVSHNTAAADLQGAGFVDPTSSVSPWVEQTTGSTTAAPNTGNEASVVNEATVANAAIETTPATPTTTAATWVDTNQQTVDTSWVTVAPNEHLITQPVLLHGAVNMQSGGWNNQAMLTDASMWQELQHQAGFGASVGAGWAEIPFSTVSTTSADTTTTATTRAETTELKTTAAKTTKQVTEPTPKPVASQSEATVAETKPAATSDSTTQQTTNAGSIISNMQQASSNTEQGAVVIESAPTVTEQEAPVFVSQKPQIEEPASTSGVVELTQVVVQPIPVQEQTVKIVVSEIPVTETTKTPETAPPVQELAQSVSGGTIESSQSSQVISKQTLDVRTVVSQGKESAQTIESEILASMKEPQKPKSVKMIPESRRKPHSEKLLKSVYEMMTSLMEKVKNQVPIVQETGSVQMKVEKIGPSITTPPQVVQQLNTGTKESSVVSSSKTVIIKQPAVPTTIPTTKLTTAATPTPTTTPQTVPTTTTEATTTPTTTTEVPTTTKAPIVDAVGGPAMSLFSEMFANNAGTTAKPDLWNAGTTTSVNMWNDVTPATSNNLVDFVQTGNMGQASGVMAASGNLARPSGGMAASGNLAQASGGMTMAGMNTIDMARLLAQANSMYAAASNTNQVMVGDQMMTNVEPTTPSPVVQMQSQNTVIQTDLGTPVAETKPLDVVAQATLDQSIMIDPMSTNMASNDVAASGMTNINWDAFSTHSQQPRSGMDALLQIMKQQGLVQTQPLLPQPVATTTPTTTTEAPTTTTTPLPTTTTTEVPTPPPIIYDANDLTPQHVDGITRAVMVKMIRQMAPTRQDLFTVLYTTGGDLLNSMGINPKHVRGSVHTALMNVLPELRRFLGLPPPPRRPRPYYAQPQPAQQHQPQHYPASASTATQTHQGAATATAGAHAYDTGAQHAGYPAAGQQTGYAEVQPRASLQGAAQPYSPPPRPTIDPIQRAMEAAMTKQVLQMLGLVPEPPDVPPGRRGARGGGHRTPYDPMVDPTAGAGFHDPYAQPYGADPYAPHDPWQPRGRQQMSPEWAGALGLGPEPGDAPPAGGQGGGGGRGPMGPGRRRMQMMEQMMDMLSF